MEPPEGQAILQLARLRRAAAVLGRGGAYATAAKVLRELAIVGHRANLEGQAVRAAWQAVAASQVDDDPTDRTQSLVVLSSTLLSSRAPKPALTAAQLARGEAERIDGPHRQAALGLVALAEGMALRQLRRAREAAWNLTEARERLVAAGRPGAAAIALTELGILDGDEGDLERAHVCFAFAREFLRLDADPAASAGLALAEAGLLTAHRQWADAAAAAEDGLADADAAGDPLLAARLAAIAVDGLWRSRAEPDVIDAASERADALLERAPAGDPTARLLRIETRIRLAARRGEDADATRQLEAAFDLAMTAGDEALLDDLLDWMVSGLVARSLPADGWALCERLAVELRVRGWVRLADLTAAALAELRSAPTP